MKKLGLVSGKKCIWKSEPVEIDNMTYREIPELGHVVKSITKL